MDFYEINDASCLITNHEMINDLSYFFCSIESCFQVLLSYTIPYNNIHRVINQVKDYHNIISWLYKNISSSDASNVRLMRAILFLSVAMFYPDSPAGSFQNRAGYRLRFAEPHHSPGIPKLTSAVEYSRDSISSLVDGREEVS